MFFWLFLWRRVNPRAASGGGAWRRRNAIVPVVQKVSQHCYGFLGVCFVILKCLNVIFVLLFLNLYNL
jgi:hypothetical protein